MALKGSMTTPASHNRSLTFSWSATQDVASNKSTINWSVVGSGSYSGYVMIHELRVSIAGASVFSSNDVNCKCYRNTQVASGTKVLSHSADGTKSFTVTVNAGIYSGSANCYQSSTFTLNAIPRGASITSVANITLGNNCDIKWTPPVAGRTYKVKLEIGSWSHTSNVLSPSGVNQYTYNYQIPVSVSDQITASESGAMVAYLYTYTDANGTSQIGATSSKSFTVTVPSNVVPVISNATISTDNSSSSVVRGWNKAVVGYTKLNVSATGTGYYGATISEYIITGAYNITVPASNNNLNYTGDYINSSGQTEIVVRARDSRGRLSASQTLTSDSFYAYTSPRISSFTVFRKASEPTTLKLKCTWSISSIDGSNTSSSTLYYTDTSTGVETQYSGTIMNDQEYEIRTFNDAKGFNFRIVVSDALSSSESVAFVPSREVLLDFRAGGKGLGVGRFATSDRLEIAIPVVFMDQVKIVDGNNEMSLEDYIISVVNNM